MSTTRAQLDKQLKEVSCDYKTLCRLFGKEEIDKHLNNAVKTVIDDFYTTKEMERANN